MLNRDFTAVMSLHFSINSHEPKRLFRLRGSDEVDEITFDVHDEAFIDRLEFADHFFSIKKLVCI